MNTYGLRRIYSLAAVAIFLSSATMSLAQTATWQGGFGNWCNPPCGDPQPQWSGGVRPKNNYDPNDLQFWNVFVDGGDGVNSDVWIGMPNSGLQILIDSLTIDQGDVVRVGNDSFLGFDTDRGGFLHNEGEIILQGSGNTASLIFGGHQGGNIPLVVTGSGKITLATNDAVINQGGANAHLINTDNIIQGFGQIGLIGNNAPLFTNEEGGLVDANVPGQTLTLNPQTSNNYVNAGIYRASGGGNLLLIESFDNQNTIEALDDSTITLGTAYVAGGLVRSVGSGSIEILGGGSSFEDLTLKGNVNAWRNFDLIGPIDNQARISLISDGNTVVVMAVGDTTTLTGGGTITMTDLHRTRVSDSLGHLTNTDNIIEGTGLLSMGHFTNETAGIVDANVAGQSLQVLPGGGVGIENQGTFRASGGGNLELLNGGNIDNTSGIIEALDGSTITIKGPTISGGTLRSEGSGSIEFMPTISFVSDVTVEGRANIDGTVYMAGTILNQAEIYIADANSTITINNTPVTVSGPGSINLAGTNPGIIGVGANAHLEVDGGILTGVGYVNIESLFNAATVSPGHSIGQLDLNFSTTMVAGTVLDIELGAATGTPGVDWDYLDVSSQRTLDFEHASLPSGVTVCAKSLDGAGTPGLLDGFDPNQSFTWLIAGAGTVDGYDRQYFKVDASDFLNPHDGFFDVENIGGGLFLTYNPQSTVVNADNLNVLLGTQSGGDISSTTSSDDSYLTVFRGNPFSPSLPSIVMEFDGVLPTETPGSLSFKIESQVDTNDVEQKIELYDYQTGAFEEIDMREASFNFDAYVEFVVDGDPARFVQPGTGNVKTRVSYTQGPASFGLSWSAKIDHLAWVIPQP